MNENSAHPENRQALRRRPRGSVLFIGLMFVVIATSIMLSVTSATHNNSRRTTDYTSREEAFFAAKGFNDLVYSEIWGGYQQAGSGNLRTFLTNRFSWTLLPVGADKVADDFRIDTVKYPLFTNKVWRASATTWNDVVIGSMQPGRIRIYRRDRDIVSQNLNVTDLMIVTEAQRNLGTPRSMVDVALASYPAPYPGVTVGVDAVWASSVVTASDPPEYSGFEYAILTKNLTCTLCHLKVQDLSRAFNTDSTKFNSYSRVKVGTTQYLAVRPGSALSSLDGTLYHRGKLENESTGATMTAANWEQAAPAFTVKAVKFNPGYPVTVKQDVGTGNTELTDFRNKSLGAIDPATGASSTPPPTGGNLYLNYPLTSEGMTDGSLPTSDFPAPFSEINGPADKSAPVSPTNPVLTNNSRIDTSTPSNPIPSTMDEIQATIDKFNGDGNIGASITGGVMATGMSKLAPYTTTSLPSAGMPANLTNGFNGNVILTGTQANPIKLDGTVVIKGDVMINGYVEGTGQVYATGNIYVPGDVIYNNQVVGGKEVFGKNTSGQSDGNNLLGLVAGKNIIIGDYLSSVTHWDSNKSNFFKPNLDGTGGKAGTPEPGMKVPYTKVAGVQGGTQSPYTDLAGTSTVVNNAGNTVSSINFANFVMEQLSVFNREELIKTLPKVPIGNPLDASKYTLTNPFYDPNHVPRYYAMYPDNYNPYLTTLTPTKANPVPLFFNSSNSWNATKMGFNTSGDPHTYNMISELSSVPSSKINPMATQQKNTLSIHPDWMSPSTMMKVLSDTESKRTATARRIDGLLYTNNAVFAIERKRAQYFNPVTSLWKDTGNPTKSNGTMTVNGAIIAPDLGVLVTGNAGAAFTVNYDARVKQFLPINASDSNRWGFPRKSFVHGSGLLK